MNSESNNLKLKLIKLHHKDFTFETELRDQMSI